MPKSASPDLLLRKKMRKGTHSCFECRRRKIRCIFPVDNPDVCSECFARGSRCIDQAQADPEVVVDHRKNLRERVSRLEALIDTLLEDRSDKSPVDGLPPRPSMSVASQALPPTPLSSDASSVMLPPQHGAERGNAVPLLSAIEDALNAVEQEVLSKSEASAAACGRDGATPPGGPSKERFVVTCKPEEELENDNAAKVQAKRERVKQNLLAVLPPYDKLLGILNSSNDWWLTWKRKCTGTTGPVTLAEFGTKALAGSNVGALGLLLLAVGISSDAEDIDSYIDAVDRWVLSDDEYGSTLEGMECLVLKAKWYADIGQPRRSWLAYRKGIMYAQLMGLHRKRTSSAAHESVWWSLYHGDRFLSLLLGLPYGVVDSHCDLTLPDEPGPYISPLVFIKKLAMTAGKVVDRNQGLAEQSFAWAVQLDQELEDLYKQVDPEWMDLTGIMVEKLGNVPNLRERLMAQMVYHQIRMYLHLPFMLKAPQNSRFLYSRNACLNGSREVVNMYRIMRTGHNEPLYECKAVDYIGFTACVLIMLGLYNYGCWQNHVPKMASKEEEDDIRLVEMCIDMFQRAASEKGGKVALQSADILSKMLGGYKDNGGSCEFAGGGATDFVIPYFGKISIRRGGRAEAPCCPRHNHAPTASATPSPHAMADAAPKADLAGAFGAGAGGPAAAAAATTTTTTTTTAAAGTGAGDPLVSYAGLYNMDGGTSGQPGMAVNEDGMNNFAFPGQNLNVPMDIDQDWSWFVNEHQAALALPQVDHHFNQNNYIGF